MAISISRDAAIASAGIVSFLLALTIGVSAGAAILWGITGCLATAAFKANRAPRIVNAENGPGPAPAASSSSDDGPAIGVRVVGRRPFFGWGFGLAARRPHVARVVHTRPPVAPHVARVAHGGPQVLPHQRTRLFRRT